MLLWIFIREFSPTVTHAAMISKRLELVKYRANINELAQSIKFAVVTLSGILCQP